MLSKKLWGKEMKIREANKKDMKNFVGLQKEAFSNLNSKKQTEYFIEKMQSNEILILEDKSKYIGHLIFRFYRLNPPFNNGIFLEGLAIKKEFQGKGYGKKLLKEIERYPKRKDIKMIYLSIDDSKKNKVKIFYKKQGYQMLGKLKEINPLSEYKCGQIFMGKIIK
jgi:ribosomal protein S18 acetylase RimI-like enzyme